ncbi:apolipoprotein N-acyltransferase [Prochlorococcus marinus]|uniref:Apolipoprotein N-acyltransferase n=1 Tax=Prochlorococcus marinus (strain MIT 9211) TaxID=93059 RepID=A9BBQ8_PROM4|nr:apolipoprotein N-acyltransferase [Prochlorococcus marinus]ABX09270.1 possible apolipoprotein n-acyltransferase [Prochlorococcus marinus str. MIT 9211]
MITDKYSTFLRAGFGGILAGVGLSQGGILLMPLAIAFLWSSSRFPLAGSIWGAVAVLISHRWLLALHPLMWMGVSQPFSLFITISIWLFCGLLGAFLSALWCWLGRLNFLVDARNGCFKRKFLYAFVLSACWGLGENVLAQSPLLWVGISSSLLPGDRLLAGLSSWFGSSGLTTVQFLVGWWLWQTGILFKSQNNWQRFFSFGLAALVFAHLFGWALLEKEIFSSSKAVAIWQSAIPTREKFSIDQLRRLPFSLEQALKEANVLGASFMVAPEGTLPIGQELLSPAQIPLLSGGFRADKGNQRSSLLVFKKDQTTFTDFVDKYRLVPLGEWIPPLPGLSIPGLSSIGGIEPGESSRLLIWDGPPIAVAICYEITNGNGLSKAVKDGAQWILAIANLDPYPISLQKQFLALAQMRSIESARDLITVSNTGPSTMISADGSITPVIPPFKQKVGLASLHFSEKITPYVRWGEKPLIVFLIAGIFGLFFLEPKA